MLKVLWIGRGGQGVVTASGMLTAGYIHEGKRAISMPEYGVERRGAPVKAYSILSLAEGLEIPREPVKDIDVAMVLEKSLIERLYREAIVGKNTLLIVNSSEYHNLFAKHPWLKEHEVWSINATKISLEVFNKPLVNMVMLGSYVRVLGSPSLHSLEEVIRDEFHKDTLIESNIRAIYRGYEEVRRLNMPFERKREIAYEIT